MIISLAAVRLLFGQTDNLTLTSGTAATDGTATLNLFLSSPAGNEPAAIQWSLGYPTSAIIAVNAVAGAMSTSAGKTISCAPSSGSYVLCWLA